MVMAEPKAKAVNGNHVPDKAPKQASVKGQNKDSKLLQLIQLAKDVGKEADAITEFEKAAELRKTLEADLEAKKSEVQKLRDLNDKVVRDFSEFKAQANTRTETLFTEFENKYKTYDSNKATVVAVEKENTELKAKLEATMEEVKSRQEEVDGLKQRLQVADSHAKSQAAEIKEMNTECEIHRSRMQTGVVELQACKLKLAEAKVDLGETILCDYGPDGLRKLGLDLKALSKKCHNLVMEYFSDPDGAKDSASEIQELKTRFPKVPLSSTSSKAAARLRCAVAEGVLADILTTQVFVPFYLVNGSKTSASSLLDLFGDDERLRSVYRCQVLRAAARDSEQASRVEEDIIRKASNEARTTLHPLVMATKQAGFYNAIPSLFRDALRLWAEVQYARDLILAEQPDPNEVQMPGKYDDYDLPTSPAAGIPPAARNAKSGTVAHLPKPAIAVVLFPQVASGEDLIFHGMALWSNQVPATAHLETPPPSPSVLVANGTMNGGEPGRHGASARRRSMAAAESPFKGKQLLSGT